MDLALNNLQRLICHKTQTTNQPTLNFLLWSKLFEKKKQLIACKQMINIKLNPYYDIAMFYTIELL